jgi:hypothetical protein
MTWSTSRKSAAMRIRMTYTTTLLATGVAAVAVAVAPTAMADPAAPDPATQSCASISSDTECQSPGNVQINDSPGSVQYSPQYPYWEGSYFDGAHRGGGHR